MVTEVVPSHESNPPRRSASGKSTLFLLVLLGLSLSLNVVLGWEVRSIRVQPSSPTTNFASSPRVTEGSQIAPLTVKKLDGTPQSIVFSDSDKPTVLYVFSLTCVWSKHNVAGVHSLAKATASTHRFFGLSLREEDYASLDAEQQKLGFPVFKDLTRETIKSLELGSTPQTIVVSPQGKVLKNWVGFYGGDIEKDVEGYFGIPVREVENWQKDISSDSPQRCTRCVLEGLFYSTGAVITISDRKLRCGTDGRWNEF